MTMTLTETLRQAQSTETSHASSWPASGYILGGKRPIAAATPLSPEDEQEVIDQLTGLREWGLQQQITDLLQDMQTHLGEIPLSIQQWMVDFLSLDDSRPEKHLLAIAILILKEIDPLIESSAADHQQLLLNWSEGWEKVLSLMLPSALSVDLFLDNCSKGLAEKRAIEQLAQLVDLLATRQLSVLQECIAQSNDLMQHQVVIIKSALNTLQEGRRTKMLELHTETTAIAQKTEEVKAETREITKQLAKLIKESSKESPVNEAITLLQELSHMRF